MTALLTIGACWAAFVLVGSSGRSLAPTGTGSIGVGGAVLGACLLGLSGSLVLLVLGPMLVFAAVGLGRHERKRRRQIASLRQLPVVVDVLARNLTAGETVETSIAALTPIQLQASGLDKPLDQIRSGFATADALASTPGLLGAALFAADMAGGSGGMTIERLADRLRSSALDGRAAQSQSGQQLASAAVMTLIPPVVSLLYGLSDARAANFYLRTPWGAFVILVSLALSLAGWFWMRFITRPRASYE